MPGPTAVPHRAGDVKKDASGAMAGQFGGEIFQGVTGWQEGIQ